MIPLYTCSIYVSSHYTSIYHSDIEFCLPLQFDYYSAPVLDVSRYQKISFYSIKYIWLKTSRSHLILLIFIIVSIKTIIVLCIQIWIHVFGILQIFNIICAISLFIKKLYLKIDSIKYSIFISILEVHILF